MPEQNAAMKDVNETISKAMQHAVDGIWAFLCGRLLVFLFICC